MNYGVIAPGDHWILIRCGLHHPMQTVPPNHRAEISVRCRGRYHLPGCFPTGETTSAQSVDNGILNIFNGIWRYHVGTWYIAARCAARFPMGIAGRLIAAPTQTVPPNYRAEISMRCRGRYYLPGCFPVGKQRRRKAPTMASTKKDCPKRSSP